MWRRARGLRPRRASPRPRDVAAVASIRVAIRSRPAAPAQRPIWTGYARGPTLRRKSGDRPHAMKHLLLAGVAALALAAMPLAARAQLLLSANDNKVVLENGAVKT